MTRREFLKCLGVLFGASLLDFSLPKVAAALSSLDAHPALFWEKLDGQKARCLLCPRKCVIPEAKRGFCSVRQNIAGSLYSLVYSKPVAVHVDPIEKKPLFHFLPATTAFSIATVGCNLRCKFCQNWEISQARPEDIEPAMMPPQEIVRQAKLAGSKTIAYTYTEPTVFYEYMLDTMIMARTAGIKNIMHSAGFINEAPLKDLCLHLDAANIDLKGFSQEFYQDVSFGNLEDILRTLKILKQQNVHLEITNLIIPTLNDNPDLIKAMSAWIKDNLGREVPLHFSRFSPMYKLANLPPTPVSTLEQAKDIADKLGLKYVYIGNIPGHKGETTYCPNCYQPLIVRIGYSVTENNLTNDKCRFCNEPIEGAWT